jgi:hypothetical protein
VQSRRKVTEFQEKCDEHLKRYESLYKDLESKYTSAHINLSETVSNAHASTEEELKTLMKHGQTLMSQKAAIILGFKDEIRRTTEHYNKVTEMQTIGKREAEIVYKEKLYAI